MNGTPMTQQFHAGQEVKVYVYSPGPIARASDWRQAKIIRQDRAPGYQGWFVRFPDGTGAVFDAAHIREVEPTREGRDDNGRIVRGW